MLPPVSDPRAIAASPAATAAAAPPLEPPGTRLLPQGLMTAPNAEFSFDEPMANSSRLPLPRMIAPAFLSRETTVASNGGTYPSKILEAAVVRTPSVDMLSLIRNGMPVMAEAWPARIISSAASAWATI